MHGRYVLKQLSRGWVRSVLWIVLLAAVTGFFTVSVGQWYAFQRNLRAMDEVFTTVAVVDDIGFWRSNQQLSRLVGVDGSVIRQFGVDKTGGGPDPEIAILEQVVSLKMVKTIDNRQSSLAFSPGVNTVVHPLEPVEAAIARAEANDDNRREVRAKYGNAFHYWELQEGIAAAVLNAKCVYVDADSSSSASILSYTAIFEINYHQSPAVHPFHRNFKYLTISTSGILPSYEFPFTVGKDYLLATTSLHARVFLPHYGLENSLAMLDAEPQWFLRGTLQGGQDILLDMPGNKRERPHLDELPSSPDAWALKYSTFTEDVATALGLPYDEYPFQWFYPLDEELILSRQELTGSVADFLESERGVPWKLAVETANKNINALNVIGTENLQAIVAFNRQDAHILEGREFNQEEYDKGAKACIISASLARENDLKLGDTLPLSMQKTGYRPQYQSNSSKIYWYQSMEFTSSFLEFTELESYHIIGIYTAPEWDYQYDSFSPNTIFIPQKAFPEEIPRAPNPPCDERAGMLSLVLRNGSQESFLNAIAGTGLVDVHVLDQGYERLAPQIRILWGEARTLFVVSSLVWVIVVAFFILLVTRRLRSELGIMVSLGVRRCHIRQSLLSYTVIISLCGLAIGGTVGTVAYQEVIARTYDSLQKVVSATETDLPIVLADIAPGLPMVYIFLQGLILILVALAVALIIRLNVRTLFNQGMKL